MKTLRKDGFITIDNGKGIISANPNAILESFEDMDDPTKRYLYKVGDKIVTPFGIQTIKEIDKNYGTQHGYEWLILVEENGNQYKPCELIGIYIKTISTHNFHP